MFFDVPYSRSLLILECYWILKILLSVTKGCINFRYSPVRTTNIWTKLILGGFLYFSH